MSMLDNQKAEKRESSNISAQEFEFYKTATNLFREALRVIMTTKGGHKCNRIASNALSVYYSMIKPVYKTTNDSEQKEAQNVNINPYADGAFIGLKG